MRRSSDIDQSASSDKKDKQVPKKQSAKRAEEQAEDKAAPEGRTAPTEDASAGKKCAMPVCGSETTGTPTEDLAQLRNQLLRLRADFDNFRKRTLREKTALCDTANEELMTELLPVLDHIQLATKATEGVNSDQAFQQGVLLIFEQLAEILKKFGLEPIDSVGQCFDPELHEAVSCIPSDEHPEGIVTAQARRGYLLKKRLIRPAQVVVSSGAKLNESASAS